MDYSLWRSKKNTKGCRLRCIFNIMADGIAIPRHPSNFRTRYYHNLRIPNFHFRKWAQHRDAFILSWDTYAGKKLNPVITVVSVWVDVYTYTKRSPTSLVNIDKSLTSRSVTRISFGYSDRFPTKHGGTDDLQPMRVAHSQLTNDMIYRQQQIWSE